LAEILFQENDVVAVGTTIAVLSTDGEEVQASPSVKAAPAPVAASNGNGSASKPAMATAQPVAAAQSSTASIPTTSGDRFYSPLVKSIAKQEGIAVAELDNLSGSGKGGRVTKKDILNYEAHFSARNFFCRS